MSATDVIERSEPVCADANPCSLARLVMPHGGYANIAADPPWHYDEFAQNCTTNRVVKPLPYASMTVTEIKGLPVRSVAAANCRLWLWATNRYLPDALQVMLAWGFAYKQTVVWHKKGNPSPWGGSVAPNHAEYLLVGARGNPPRKAMLKTNVIAANVSRHSKKPDVFYDLIMEASEGPYLEMFARERRLGWDAWGNEA